MKWLLFGAAFFVLLSSCFISCARMGQPDGGWYDDTPPRVTSATPADKSIHVDAKKITINFNEFIKMEDAQNKVIVSPPQLEMPDIKASGKRILVELKDSLKPNTTYTIDFSDAISDNNEGNPMGNYTYSFSTGEQIDTFEVSGYVLNAENLEPIKGVLVGLYDNLSDTIFRHEPMIRVSRTDARGHFNIKGVAPGEYRCYALEDADGDFVYNQKSETIGFSHDTIRPSSKPDFRQDTLWRDTLHIDDILRVPYTHFLPDDITLLAFKVTQTDRYLLKTERVDPNKFSVYFSYGHDSLPRIKGLNFDADSAFVLEASAKRDTLHYWLRDTALVNRDTLTLEMSYYMTDSVGSLVLQTDTIEALPKVSYAKRMKEQQKELEKWQKEQEKKKKREEPYDSIYPVKPLALKFSSSGSLSPDQNIVVESATPLAQLDTAVVHLYSMIDSVWYESPFLFQQIDVRRFRIMAEWRQGVEYSLEIDSAGIADIYGLEITGLKQGLKVRTNDEFSSFIVSLSGVKDTGVVVQLLNSSDAVVKQARAKNNSAEFYYLPPGKYYVRAFVDANGNNIWDTGDYDENRQAEAVYYYPDVVECKEKWDVTKRWNLTAVERHKQKPAAIVKQKPEAAKKQRNRNAERAKQLGIQYLKDKGVNL